MNNEYRFNLPDHRSAMFRKLSLFIYFINAGALILTGVYAETRIKQYILFGAGILTILLAFADHKKPEKKIFAVVYFVCAATWIIITPFWYLGIMNIILALLHFSIERKKFISFTDSLVVAQGGNRKEWQWEEIGQVILKDGLLTIDFKNNRIIQVEPEPAVNDNKDYTAWEREFNDFCRLKLKA